MGWLVNPGAYKKAEREVLKKGISHFGLFGKIMADGEMRTVNFSHMPLYHDGKITGLVGYFTDWEEEQKNDGVTIPLRTDPGTGLPNAHAFVDAMIDFAQDFHQNSMDFALLAFGNMVADRIIESYGEDFENKVMKKMGEIILEDIGTAGIVSRPKDTILTVLVHIDSKPELDRLKAKIVKDLEGLREVDGNPVTITVSSFARLRSKSDMTAESLFEKALKSVRPGKKQ